MNIKRRIIQSLPKSKRAWLSELRFPFSSIDKKLNIIFIHVPKTGGTSLRVALGYPEKGRIHLPWYVYAYANSSYFQSAFKFAFVRNPWDRAFSAYRYFRSGGNKLTDDCLTNQISKFSNFDEFVIKGLGEGNFRSHALFLPQSDFLVNSEGNICVDHLGKFETYDKDANIILAKIGLKSVRVDKLNSSGVSRDFRIEYRNPKSIDTIYELYRQDINIFDYAFEK